MAIPVKPVKLAGAVKPVGVVKPVGAPAQVTPASVAKPAAKINDNGFDELFGKQSPAPAQVQHKEELKQAVSKVEAGEGPKTGEKVKEQKKPADKKSKDAAADKKPEPKKEYTGPKVVKVYGQTLFTETDPKVTLEAIRDRIVREFGYDEFSASRTTMSLDEETGIVVPQISFQKKG